MDGFVVRPLAEADLEEAFAWYEGRSVGLGLDFLRAADACFEGIRAAPLGYPAIYRGARRALLRRFPYGVFYVTDGSQTEVLACVHTRQHPRRWRRRA